MDKFVVNNANVIEVDKGVEATGDVPVTVHRGDATTLTSGIATPDPVTTAYTFPLTPSQLTVLDDYSAVWLMTINGAVNPETTLFQVAGGVYFSVAEARAFRGGKLADPARFSMQSIVDAREEIEEDIEEYCGRAFVRRGRRALLSGRGVGVLELADWHVDEIFSLATIDGSTNTAYGSTELADLFYGSRQLSRRDGTTFPWGNRNISIHYSYGMATTPEPIKRAALLMLVDRMIGSDVSVRATNFTNESGTTQYSMPDGKDKPTGIPEADAILNRWKVGQGAYSIQIASA